MIIAAYAGTGKSFFAKNQENAIDMPIMPYKWILPITEQDGEAEFETEKGAMYHLHNPLFTDNYIADILEAEKKYKYVIIPSDMRIVECLQEEYSRKVILIYPKRELKEEYRKRYLERGNTESFLGIFIGYWDEYLDCFAKNKRAAHILLQSGEYLLDVKEQIDKKTDGMDGSEPVDDAEIQKLRCKIAEQKNQLTLFWNNGQGIYLYPIKDYDNPDERSFLYDVGRFLLEKQEGANFVRVLPNDVLKFYLEEEQDYFYLDSMEAFWDVVRK